MFERVLTILVVLALTGALVADYYRDSRNERRIQRLEWACYPVNTGGGVEQCLQPNVDQTHSKVVTDR